MSDVNFACAGHLPRTLHVGTQELGDRTAEIVLTSGEEVGVFRGHDGALVFQVCTDANGQKIRVNLNDAVLFNGDPEVHDVNSDPALALWFTPDAIRDHFEDYDDLDDLIEGATDAQLEKVGRDILNADGLYAFFHEVLVQSVRTILLDGDQEEAV